MPRKRESVLNTSAVSGTMVIEINDLKVDNDKPPRLPPEMVRVSVPEGYEEDRVPPPAAPAAPAPVAETTPPDSKGTPNAAPVEESKPAAPVEPETPRIVAAPAFELLTPTGEKVSLASLKGKVVVLQFAGSWCISLRDAHPELEALTQQYKDRGVAVYLVNVREKSNQNMVNDLAEDKATFGLLLNGDQVATQYRIMRYPSYCVIDKEGLLTLTEPGFVKNQTIPAVGQAIEAALGNAPAAGNSESASK
jgi:thiol-disulfide isomerase/thioredoxin